MAHQFSRTESRVWNAGLLWRSIYHALLLIDFTCFDKILFCGPSSNPHCIIPGLRKGGGKEKNQRLFLLGRRIGEGACSWGGGPNCWS